MTGRLALPPLPPFACTDFSNCFEFVVFGLISGRGGSLLQLGFRPGLQRRRSQKRRCWALQRPAACGALNTMHAECTLCTQLYALRVAAAASGSAVCGPGAVVDRAATPLVKGAAPASLFRDHASISFFFADALLVLRVAAVNGCGAPVTQVPRQRA